MVKQRLPITISLCEYIENLLIAYQCVSLSYPYEYGNMPTNLINVQFYLQQISQVIEKIGYMQAKQNDLTIFVEKDPAAIAVAEGEFIPESLSYRLISYNHAYTNTQDIIESNGSGDILWDKTINETFTLLSNNRPYYPELLTMKRVNDDFDFFKRLHECILTRCTAELRDADLLDLFDIIGIDISDEQIDSFGDKEYILDRIAKELDVQFNTRKQLLLKTLYAYIANSSTLDDLDCFSMFGTNSFSLVWEKVCAEVMDNQLQKPIGGLRLPVPLAEQYRDIRHKKLIDLIDKPQWAGTAPSGEPFVKQAEDTLIPDLISIVNADGNYQFIIFDAKYYNIQLEHNKRLRGQPGIESITKQYLYQLAYQPFAEAHQINTVRNCFLMPTDSAEVVEKGTVSLSMLSNLGLQDIQVRLLPAETVYRHYLENTKMDIRILNL